MMRRVLFVLAAAAVLCVLSVVGGVRGEGLSLHTAPFRLDGGMEEHWVQGRESRGLLKDEHRAHPHRVETQTLYVALKVRRFEELDALFWDVSNPKSEAYGQYKTIEELADLVAPEMEDAEIVLDWIASVAPECTGRGDAFSPTPELSLSRDFIRAECPLEAAERLLGGARFHHFHHRKSGRFVLRTVTPLRVPDAIAERVAFIGGANTPIHHYEMGSPQVVTPSMPDWLRSGALAKVEDNAPAIVSAQGLDGTVGLNVQIRCKSGKLNTDTGSVPCKSDAPAVASLDVLVTSSRSRESYSVPTAAISCANRESMGATMNVCTFSVGDGQRLNYVPTHAQLATVYADGSMSNMSEPTADAVFSKAAVTPYFLWDLYRVPPDVTVVSDESNNAVAEFLKQYYNPEDLENFFLDMGLPTRAVERVVGFNNATEGSISGGEAQLDIQYIMGVALNSSTWFWSVSGLNKYNQEEPFLEWLFQIGNDTAAPLVHSVSYSDLESSLPNDYIMRIEAELAKAGTRGISMLFASGDDGTASYYGRTNRTFCEKSHPAYPSDSVYVTSVGGTQLSREHSKICTKTARGFTIGCNQPREVVCSAGTDGVITSGGGFSNVLDMPDYQKDAVAEYLANTNTRIPGAGFYNPNGRAYPDLSGYSVNYMVRMGEDYQFVAGTSASTPLIAALVTLWNDMRLRTGQPPLGPLNQFLYQTAADHPSAFWDVVTGENNCLVRGVPCCDENQGFEASVGWDPVTGLGTPRFDYFAQLMLNADDQFVYASASSAGTPGHNGSDGEDGTDAGTTLGTVALVVSLLALAAAGYVLYRTSSSDGDRRPLLGSSTS